MKNKRGGFIVVAKWVEIFLLFVFAFFSFYTLTNLRTNMAKLPKFYLDNADAKQNGFFASHRIGDNVFTTVAREIKFSENLNEYSGSGDISSVWRSIFSLDRTGIYNFQANTNCSMLVYVDGLLRLNLYQEGVLKNKNNFLVLRKGYHTLRIVCKGSQDAGNKNISFSIKKYSSHQGNIDFIPVNISEKLQEEVLIEDIIGKSRSSFKIVLFISFVLFYCFVFRRYFSYMFKYVFIIVFLMCYMFPDLHFVSCDEVGNVFKSLGVGSLGVFAGFKTQVNTIFYTYLNAGCFAFGYRLEGIRFALALSGAITAVFMLKVFLLLFPDSEDKKNMLFLQPVMWFSFFAVVCFVRFSGAITSVAPCLFFYALYLYLKSHKMHCRGYTVLFVFAVGVLLGLLAVDNIANLIFIFTLVIVSLIIHRISLIERFWLLCGFVLTCLLFFKSLWLQLNNCYLFDGNLVCSFDASKKFVCDCFSLSLLSDKANLFYIINFCIFAVVFLLFVVMRYRVKRKYGLSLLFCLLTAGFMSVAEIVFSRHYNLNSFYLPLLFVLLAFSGLFFELITCEKKTYRNIAYTLFLLILLLNAASLVKYFSWDRDKKSIGKALNCEEAALPSDEIKNLYYSLQKQGLTCVFAEKKIRKPLSFMDLPYGNFRFFEIYDYVRRKEDKKCQGLKKALVSVSNHDDKYLEEKYGITFDDEFIKINL